jgi:hypothetical protein
MLLFYFARDAGGAEAMHGEKALKNVASSPRIAR